VVWDQLEHDERVAEDSCDLGRARVDLEVIANPREDVALEPNPDALNSEVVVVDDDIRAGIESVAIVQLDIE